MSVLSDVSLRAALGSLSSVRLRVNGLTDAAMQPASLDLTLGPIITAPVVGQRARLKTGELPERYTHTPITDEPFELRPGMSVLGATAERIEIPNDLVGLLVGRSTVARLFVQVEAAGLLDPGYRGNPTLEITNHGPHTVYLDEGVQIAQLLLLRLTTPVQRPYGSDGLGSKYQGDAFPIPARARKEAAPCPS